MICDCGHKPSEHGKHTTGYGYDSHGKTSCYDCCTEHDKRDLVTAAKIFHYIDSDGKTLTNWPGRRLGRVIYWGALHPWSRERRYVRVKDCHGQEWYGTGAEGMYASLTRCV